MTVDDHLNLYNSMLDNVIELTKKAHALGCNQRVLDHIANVRDCIFYEMKRYESLHVD